MATNWDKDKPAGTTKIRLSDEQIRANWAALEDALEQDHYFPGNEGSDAGEHKHVKFYAPIATPGNEANKGFLYLKDVDAKVELHFLDEDNNEIQITSVGAIMGMFPAGTKMYFYQDVAPAGWTIDAACADALLAVKGGADAFDVDGGNQAGTWTQPNHTHTGPSHTHGMSHNHKWYENNAAGNLDTTFDADGNVQNLILGAQKTAGGRHIENVTVNTVPIGDAWSKTSTKTLTDAEGTGDTGDGATADTYRPLAQVGIIATKD